MALLAALALGGTASCQDAFVLYAGSGKSSMRTITAALEDHLEIRGYNVGLLSLADYSGKQKAVARFNRSKLVIVIGDAAQKPLKGITLVPAVVFVDTSRALLASRSRTVCIMRPEEGSTRKHPEGAKLVTIREPADLAGSEAMDADAILVEKPSSTVAVAAELAKSLLVRRD